MSDLKGINVSSTIVPYTTEDKFATHDSKYGKGGFKSVLSIVERDEIPEERLSEGTLVYVKEDDTKKHFYQYLNGSWEVAEITGKGTTTTNNLEEFKEYNDPGSITYSNTDEKFYTIVVNSETGEKELKPLDTYEIDEVSNLGSDIHKVLLSNSEHDFFTSSDNIYLIGNRLCVPKLNLGNTAIRSNATERCELFLPITSGTVALNADVLANREMIADLNYKVSNLIIEDSLDVNTLINGNIYDSMNRRSEGKEITDPDYFYDEGYGKILTLDYSQINENDYHQRHVLLYVTGAFYDGIEVSDKPTKLTKLFTDIISISAAVENFPEGNRVCHLNTNTNNLFWWTDDRENYKLSLYTSHHTYFTVKILNKSAIETVNRKITFEPYINYVSDTRPDNFNQLEDFYGKSYYDNEIEKIETEINKTPSVYNLNYFASGSVSENINIDEYNVFVINSNNFVIGDEKGKYSITVEPSEDIYKKSFKFIFISPNNFKYFQLKYGNDLVLDIEDLNLNDGDGIYVTPRPEFYNEHGVLDKTWAYYLESTELPNHDDTIKVVTVDNKPAISVPIVETKMYQINYKTQENFMDNNDTSYPYLEKIADGSCILHTPVDTGTVFIQCSSYLYDLLEVEELALSKIVPLENKNFLDNQEIGLKIDLYNSSSDVLTFEIKTVTGSGISSKVEDNSFYHLSNQDGTGWANNTVYNDGKMHYLRIKRVPYDHDLTKKTWRLLFNDRDTGTVDSPITDSEITRLLTDLDII